MLATKSKDAQRADELAMAVPEKIQKPDVGGEVVEFCKSREMCGAPEWAKYDRNVANGICLDQQQTDVGPWEVVICG